MLNALRRMFAEPTGRRASLALAAVGWGMSTLLNVRDELSEQVADRRSREAAAIFPYLTDELSNRCRFLSEAIHEGCKREDVVHELAQLRLLHKQMVEELASVNDVPGD